MSTRTKPTNLKLHDFPIESFIGGYYIPDKICDDLIDWFESNPDKQHQGSVNETNYKKQDVNEEVLEKYNDKEAPRFKKTLTTAKKSIDIGLLPAQFEEDAIVLKDYFFYLNQCIKEYEYRYDVVRHLSHYGTVEGVNLQKYEPGDGFYEWHSERSGAATMTRCLVHMTYLNDVDDGGTEFLYQNLTSPAKKGLTLIWPSDWTHTHKGQISQTQTKYILTGWLNYRD